MNLLTWSLVAPAIGRRQSLGSRVTAREKLGVGTRLVCVYTETPGGDGLS